MILYEGTNDNINMFFRNSVPEFLRLVDEILKEEIRIFFKYLLWDNLKISRFFFSSNVILKIYKKPY